MEPPGLAFPTITLRAALASNPFATSPSWSDLSDYFAGATIRRGRQDSLQQFEAGRATITLHNRDRRFDPFHTSGPYTTTFRPGKRVNLRANWSGTDYDIYTGYIDRIRPVWPSPADAMVEVELVDAFSILTTKDPIAEVYPFIAGADFPSAYYRMHDAAGSTTMTDSSGFSRHGTYNGSGGKQDAPGGVYGDSGKSMDCGNATHSAVGPTAAGFTGAVPHAVSMLVYYAANPGLGNNWTLFDQDIGGGGRFLLSITDANKVRIDCFGGPIDSVATLKQYAWNYISAGIDGSNNFRLRVNDAAVVTGTYTGGAMTQNPPHIGEDYLGNKDFFGYIDEVAIYNETVIPADATTLYLWEWSSAGLNDQLASDRIDRLLDHIGWPAGDRSLSSTHTLTPVVEPLAGRPLLSHMYDVARTEGGLFFMDGAGKVVFTDEIGSAPASSVTFGEGSGEIHYAEGPGAEYSWEHISNEVTVRAVATAALNDAHASDSTSVAEYGPRTLTVDGLLFRDQADLDDRADYLLALKKDPRKRIRNVKVRAQDDTANTLSVLLNTELGDTVTVKRTPVGGGSTISVLSLVDGISHTIGPDTWVTEYALSPW